MQVLWRPVSFISRTKGREMNFPITETPINSTTAFVLQKSKEPENDYEKLLEEWRFLQKTYKTILSGKNTPERKQQLKILGRKINANQTKICNVKRLLKIKKRYDLGRCFMEICCHKMPHDEFMEIWEQAHKMSDALRLADKLQQQKEEK